MIFTQLTVTNFGVFHGSHVLNLEPISKDKPIILIGGLNGVGKTTLLDALQLVLYGKFAQCSNRGTSGYETFLEQAMNHRSEPGERSSIAVEFLISGNTDRSKIHATREWYKKGNKILESLKVLVDGVERPLVAENWGEFVDEFLPRNIASLFFFDGEKIEELASPQTASKIIETGLVSLFGLEMVDKLGADLQSVDRRRQKSKGEPKADEEIVRLETEIIELEGELQQATLQKASVTTTIDSLEGQIRSANEAFQRAGGEYFTRREEINAAYASALTHLAEVEEELRTFLAGNAPLCLVQKLTAQAKETSINEDVIISDRMTIDILKRRDAAIITQISKQYGESELSQSISSLMDKDIVKRSRSADRPTFLNVKPDGLAQYDEQFFVDIADSQNRLKCRHLEATRDLEEWGVKQSMVPDEQGIRLIMAELNELETEKLGQESALSHITDEEQTVMQRLKNTSEQLEKALARINETQIKDFQNRRLLRHSAGAQKTLKTYRKLLIEKNLDSLEQQINECFETLSRKDSLVEKIKIDAADYALKLIRKNGLDLPTKRLSAGERQLLAIAVLWGLAKSSGQSMPTIIDTPLGRLDSAHRQSLIQRYFPHASDQVIMLSTDTEVDEVQFGELRPHVSHNYHIEFVEKLNSSIVTEGYF